MSIEWWDTMVSKILLIIIGFVIINVGSFVRLQIFQNSISCKEFKAFIIIINIVYIVFVFLYIIGILK